MNGRPRSENIFLPVLVHGKEALGMHSRGMNGSDRKRDVRSRAQKSRHSVVGSLV